MSHFFIYMSYIFLRIVDVCKIKDKFFCYIKMTKAKI